MEDRSERLTFLREKHADLVRKGVKPIMCPKVKGQISLAEYPVIDDRHSKAMKDAQKMDYKQFWANQVAMQIPDMYYPTASFTPTSKFAFISQFLP